MVGVVILFTVVIPEVKMSLHHRQYWKGVEQIRTELEKDEAFASVQTHLGKSPNIPIVIYGPVRNEGKFGRIKKIIEPYRAKYEIEFRVFVESNMTNQLAP